MILTVTTLPSIAETHGSQRPNVTIPFVSIAPSDPSGIRFMRSRCLSIEGCEKGLGRYASASRKSGSLGGLWEDLLGETAFIQRIERGFTTHSHVKPYYQHILI